MNPLSTLRKARPSRLVGGLFAGLVALYVLSSLFPEMEPLARTLFPLLTAVLCLAGFRGWGSLLLGLFRPSEKPDDEPILSFGLGVLAFQLLVFLLGCAQLFRRPVGWVLFTVLLVGGLFLSGSPAPVAKKPLRGGSIPGEKILITFLCFCLILTAAVYLLGSLMPPMAYDALEYHLGAPHLYLQRGGIYRIHGNVYSNFPFNTQMLYTFSLLLFPWGELAKLFHYSFALVIAWGVIRYGARAAGRAIGLIAGLFFLSSPMVLGPAMTANIDLGTALFGFCAMLALREWFVKEEKRALWLSGIFAGAAIGTKYTAGIIVFFPILLTLFLMAIFSKEQGQGRAIRFFAKNAILFGIPAGIVLLPWLLKNLVLTGNPFFPLLYGLFGGSEWTRERAEIFNVAHEADLFPVLRDIWGKVAGRGFSIAGALRDTWTALTAGSVLLALAFIPPRFRNGSRKTIQKARMDGRDTNPTDMKSSQSSGDTGVPPVEREDSFLRYAWFSSMTAVILWLALTKRVDRFILPVLPFLSLIHPVLESRAKMPRLFWWLFVGLLSAHILWVDFYGLYPPGNPVTLVAVSILGFSVAVFMILRGERRLSIGVFGFLLCLHAFLFSFRILGDLGHLGVFRYLSGAEDRWEFYARGLPHWRIIREINELPEREKPKILMVGEARPFGIRYPVEMSTVFDDSGLLVRYDESSGNLEDLHRRLLEDGFTHVFYNEFEIARLLEMYAFVGWKEGHAIRDTIRRMGTEGYLDMKGKERERVFLAPIRKPGAP